MDDVLTTDAELLRAFADTRSPAAFAELARRHVDLVYSVARRSVGGAHAAEDVCQVTFAVLARKAGSINAAVLPGWLVTTARLAAKEAVRSNLCRARHEVAAGHLRHGAAGTDPDAAAVEELTPLLDDALARLRPSDRSAVVLRFLEGMSFAEVGRAAGIGEEAARKRVTRAVDQLRAIFAKRGLLASSTAVLALLAASGAKAAPPAVALASSAPTSGLSPWGQAVTRKVMNIMKLHQIKAAVLVTCSIAAPLGIATGVWALQSAQASGPTAAPRPPAAVAADPAAASRPSSKLDLTLAWDHGRYTVPRPASVPDAMVNSSTYQQWWRVGDVRTLTWTDAAGQRYVVDALGRLDAGHGTLLPILPKVSRYRSDGTLEITTLQTPQGQPSDWTLFAADGRTKTVSVANRLGGIEGTPYVQYVHFFDPAGHETHRYQANRYGVVYLDWYYNANGQADHWNGTSKLNLPIDQLPPTTRPAAGR